MGDLKYYTRESGWVAFKKAKVWFFIALTIAFFVLSEVVDFDKWYYGFVLFLITVILITYYVIKAHYTRFYFYDDRIVNRKNIFRRDENNFAFMGVLEVTINQSFLDRIFMLGSVTIDFVGQNSIDKKKINNIAHPRRLKKYLETRIAREADMAKIVM